ncbi:hypothetical protein HZA57_00140 [Candidatus Poribacteria bacterium]|nr:hypothetical protein [Candidatus Poribacteria bacterium]
MAHDGSFELPPYDPETMPDWELSEYETLRWSASLTFAQRIEWLSRAQELARLGEANAERLMRPPED